MNNFFRKYLLIIVLLAVAIIMILVKVKYKDYEWVDGQSSLNLSVTPTVTLKPTKPIDPEYPLWQELPYQGNGFIVDRYLDKRTVVVIPKGLDDKIVEKEVWEWFEGNNVATDEMKIVWE